MTVRNDLGEDLTAALERFEGAEGAASLRRALRELPLDGATALAIVDRLSALEV